MNFAYAQYRSASVETASPLTILIQLYSGALRFMHDAAKAIDEGNFAKKGENLSRAQRIVTELRCSLHNDKAPELCLQLEQLYDYVSDCLTQANIHLDKEAIEHASKVMEELRSGWVELAEHGA